MHENMELVEVTETVTRVYRRAVPAGQVPVKPSVTGFKFIRKGRDMQVEVLLSEVRLADHVTSRKVDLSINGEVQAQIDAMTSTPAWSCNVGDELKARVTDINSAGATESDPYEGSASLPFGPPTKPNVMGFLFSGSDQPYVDPRKESA